MVRAENGTWYGLSTDAKPTPAVEAVKPGDLFLEVDTGTQFVYDKSLAAWVPFGFLGPQGAALSYQVVDLSDATPVEILGAPGSLFGIYVLVALSAHACPVTDNDVAIMTLPASAPVGAFFQAPAGLAFATDLELVPNAAATGTVAVFYRAA
jgi:hypothetical protein